MRGGIGGDRIDDAGTTREEWTLITLPKEPDTPVVVRRTRDTDLLGPVEHRLDTVLAPVYLDRLERARLECAPDTDAILCHDGATRHLTEHELARVLVGRHAHEVVVRTVLHTEAELEVRRVPTGGQRARRVVRVMIPGDSVALLWVVVELADLPARRRDDRRAVTADIGSEHTALTGRGVVCPTTVVQMEVIVIWGDIPVEVLAESRVVRAAVRTARRPVEIDHRVVLCPGGRQIPVRNAVPLGTQCHPGAQHEQYHYSNRH